ATGANEPALAALQRVLVMDSHNVEANRLTAEVLVKLERKTEAAEYYRRALLISDDPNMRFRTASILTELYKELGDNERWREIVEWLAEVDSRNPQVVDKALQFYFERGLLDKAAALTDRVVQEWSTDRQMQYR